MPAWPGKGEPSTNSSLSSQVVRDRLDALHEGDFEPLRVSQQATPNMTVLVQQDRGHAYVDGNNPLDFAGGNSPAFTAPAGAREKRIDLLHIDKTGTLAITQGTATTGTPVAPQYPTNKMVLAEIFLRQGMSVIKDTDDATNGYILQRRQPLLNIGGGSVVMLDGGVNKVNLVGQSSITPISFTNVDISADTGGDTAKIAILQVRAKVTSGGGADGDPYAIKSRFRKGGSSATINLPSFECGSMKPGNEIRATQTIWVEVDSSEIFQYDLNNAPGILTNSTYDYSIDLIGYMR